MGEVRFYHLTTRPLEWALPQMLERTLDRGGRAVIRAGSPDRLGHLDTHLWTYADDSFLPHGRADAHDAQHQPVVLTTAREIPNKARTLFLVDGAETSSDEAAEMEITAILFDGHDEAAVERARSQWRQVTGAGLAAVYWAQDDSGRWQKKSESAAREK